MDRISDYGSDDRDSTSLRNTKYATPSYVTVLAETVQGKGRTLFVRLGVIRTDGRGGNVAPKVVIRFGRLEGTAEGSRSTNKKKNSGNSKRSPHVAS